MEYNRLKPSAGKTKSCVLHNALHVPKLASNLLSVTKASEAGKVVILMMLAAIEWIKVTKLLL